MYNDRLRAHLVGFPFFWWLMRLKTEPVEQIEQLRNPRFLWYIGGYTTQLYGDYTKPL